MKDGCGDYRNELQKLRAGNASQEKINTLLEDLLEKEEEIALYKNRLKELEAAFYYNLELISERDLELSVLEKQLADENEQLEEVSRERNQLEDLVKTINEKNYRKIQQLEKKLTLKEEEIRDLQRDNLSNFSTLKGIIDDIKQQEENKLNKMSTKFEIQKNELIKTFQEQIDSRETYYLLEIDNLTRKLDQVGVQGERQTRVRRRGNQRVKISFSRCGESISRKRKPLLGNNEKNHKVLPSKVNKEVQCGHDPQRIEKIVQAEPEISVADSQTSQEILQREHYEQKISFLQEQNEVLKFIIKDLKRTRKDGGQPPGCECFTMKTDVEQVNEKFETEISNLKKILEKELRARAEEDAIIQSLETSVTCLKDKLHLELQQKLHQFSGDDIFGHICNRQIQNEIQVTHLEQKLCQKMDSFVTLAEDDRQKVHQKLEELKECFYRVDTYLKTREGPMVKKTKNFEKNRMEIQKLENKTETDMRNMLSNNCETDKCYKVVQEDSQEEYCKSDPLPERQKCERKAWRLRQALGKQLEDQMAPRKFINNLIVGS